MSRTFLAPLVATTLLVTPVNAASGSIYAPLIVKVLQYDRAFPADLTTATLLVVHNGTSDEECEAARRALATAGLQVRAVALKDLDADIGNPFALCACAGVDVKKVSAVAAKRKLLSFSMDYSAVVSGSLSVGFEGDAAQSPKIVINLARVKVEGHDLDSRMLAAVKVIRDISIPANTASAQDGPVEFNNSMTPAEFVSGPNPQYTRRALENKVEGEMVVKCVVAVSGEVRNCRVVKGLPHMNEAVVSAFERRRYKPATLNGKAVAVDYTFRVKLALP